MLSQIKTMQLLYADSSEEQQEQHNKMPEIHGIKEVGNP